ncbi:hypothetical protein PsorP6_007407 [Peronosclerospora sorghi]|uniref:Uncharacterized protein n=1 Tax=Peronosclerospora sorghi TaxID=230839 RepID=A0ACC0WA18_9STRA|nr:hypothetical protein PsorP6_007407 [Peronosclerospora sorghi]
MLESGEKHPTVYCLGRATVAYAGANRYEHSRACWHKIVAMKEPNPIPTKYNKMLQGLTYCKDLELAVEVFEYVHDLSTKTRIQPPYAHVALDVFESLFCALCESDDAVLAATLVLKYARLHGVRAVHPNRVIRVTTALV